MKNMYCLSVGQCIQTTQKEKNIHLVVKNRQGEHTLTTETLEEAVRFFLWHGACIPTNLSSLKVSVETDTGAKHEAETIFNHVEILKNQRLMVLIDFDQVENSLRELSEISLFAAGHAGGEHKGKYRLYLGFKAFKVSQIQFKIWQLSHRYSTLGEIYQVLESEGVKLEIFFRALLDLYGDGLVYLN